MKEFREGIVQADDLTIHYYRASEQNRPAILFLHGIMDRGLCWTPVGHDLEARYKVVQSRGAGHNIHRDCYQKTLSAVQSFLNHY